MINKACDYVTAGKYHHPYKYVIIDEYQDISRSRYNLIKAMRDTSNFDLFCVGDDWQSIFQFTGSNIKYTTNFKDFWGPTETSKIETTYRFSDELIKISSQFIMENPNQLKKELKASNDTEKNVLFKLVHAEDKDATQLIVAKLEELPKNSIVFFIGRYNRDCNLLKSHPHLAVIYNNSDDEDASKKIVLKTRGDLTMIFSTAHKSKGLQADYIFIINNREKSGFPCTREDSALKKMMLEQSDGYPHSEERRLFYVAMTRAKRKVYLLVERNNQSCFIEELNNYFIDGKNVIESDKSYSLPHISAAKNHRDKGNICPKCGANMEERINRSDGRHFWGCEHHYKTGCRGTRNIEDYSTEKTKKPDIDPDDDAYHIAQLEADYCGDEYEYEYEYDVVD